MLIFIISVHVQKCLKIHQLDITKRTRKNIKQNSWKISKLPEEEKEKGEQYKNPPEDKNPRLVKYRKWY